MSKSNDNSEETDTGSPYHRLAAFIDAILSHRNMVIRIWRPKHHLKNYLFHMSSNKHIKCINSLWKTTDMFAIVYSCTVSN